MAASISGMVNHSFSNALRSASPLELKVEHNLGIEPRERLQAHGDIVGTSNEIVEQLGALAKSRCSSGPGVSGGQGSSFRKCRSPNS